MRERLQKLWAIKGWIGAALAFVSLLVWYAFDPGGSSFLFGMVFALPLLLGGLVVFPLYLIYVFLRDRD